MDFLSLLWAAFLAFGPVWLAHVNRKKKKSGTSAPGTGHLTNDQLVKTVRTRWSPGSCHVIVCLWSLALFYPTE